MRLLLLVVAWHYQLAYGHADEKLDSPRSQRRNYSVRTTEVYERRDAKSR